MGDNGMFSSLTSNGNQVSNGDKVVVADTLDNVRVLSSSKANFTNGSMDVHRNGTGKNVQSYRSSFEDVNHERIKEGSDEGQNTQNVSHTSFMSNWETCPLVWLPPEPEDVADDMEDSVANNDDDDDYSDGMKWGQPSSSTNFHEENGISYNHKEQRDKAMMEAMNGQFKFLVGRFLASEGIAYSNENDGESWLDIVSSLSWEAALLVKPDANEGSAMDPASYVKVKRVAYGSRIESKVINGLVFKKNTAHKHMRTMFTNPKLLLLRGVLGEAANGLSSFNTMKQDKDYLKSDIEIIETCHPDVVLVEKSVSRDAQESLLAKGITLVFDMKLPRLERIARCIGSPIISSAEITTQTKLRQCDHFYIEKFVEVHNQSNEGGKKSSKPLMFFEGCPKPLGCTILLKGASSDELKKVKRVMHYTVFAAYHLILETLFFADQRVTSLDTLIIEGKNYCTNKLVSSPRNVAAAHSSTSDPEIGSGSMDTVNIPAIAGAPEKSDIKSCLDVNTDNFCADVTSDDNHSLLREGHLNQIYSGVIQLKKLHDFPGPLFPMQLTSSVSSSIRKLGLTSSATYGFSKHFQFHEDYQDGQDTGQHNNSPSSDAMDIMKDFTSKFDEGKIHILEDINIESISNLKESLEHVAGASHVVEITQKDDTDVVLDPHLNKSLEHVDGVSHVVDMTQKDDIDAVLEPQSILVLFSSHSIKGTICEQNRLTRIKYYGNFDKSLGRFLQDILQSEKPSCAGCGESPEYHTRCYTHQNGRITVQVKKLTSYFLPGKIEGKIWMWTRCLKCQQGSEVLKSSKRLVMSTAACSLSFGKFLELSFSSHSAARKLSTCGHLLHRDCLRFYGLGSKVAMFRYEPVEIYAACKPPPLLEFKSPVGCEWFEKEAKDIKRKGDQLFSEIEIFLWNLKLKFSRQKVNLPGFTREFSYVEEMLRQEKSEFETATSCKQLLGQSTPAIVDLTYLKRELLVELYVWDCRLHSLLSHKMDNDVSLGSTKDEQHCADSASLSDMKEVNDMQDDEKIIRISFPAAPINMEVSSIESNHINKSLGVPSVEKDPLGNRSGGASKFLNDAVAEIPVESGSVLHDATPYIPDENSEISCVVGDEDSDSFPMQADGKDFHDGRHSDFGFELDDSIISADVPSGSVDPEKQTCFYVNEDPSKIIVEGPEDWIWSPFSEIRETLWKDHKNGCSTKFDFIFRYSPEHLSPLYQVMIAQERECLCYPVGDGGIIISVHEEEVSSIIASALVLSQHHYTPLDEKYVAKDKTGADNEVEDMHILAIDATSSFWSSSSSLNPEQLQSFQSLSSVSTDGLSPLISEGSLFVDHLLSSEHWHPEIHLGVESGKSKYSVVSIYAKQFYALRRHCCPSETAYISSLSRCKKWDAQGGKSKALFAKTLDDRFVIKQIKRTELDSFLKFAPEYFKHVSHSLSSGSQTCLGKILGIYQVRQIKGGKEVESDLMVMENLLFGRNVSRIYDLKGVTLSRYISDPSEPGAVLLDQNFVEDMGLSPMYVGGRTKHLLQRAIWNDTSFLTSINVMDYSLLVGVDKERHELVFGIIDYLRQYTLDKQLETWVKSSLVVPKNSLPTIISPKEYKKRFRNFMSKNFLTVPDSWTSDRSSNSCKTDSRIDSSQTRCADLEENSIHKLSPELIVAKV